MIDILLIRWGLEDERLSRLKNWIRFTASCQELMRALWKLHLIPNRKEVSLPSPSLGMRSENYSERSISVLLVHSKMWNGTGPEIRHPSSHTDRWSRGIRELKDMVTSQSCHWRLTTFHVKFRSQTFPRLRELPSKTGGPGSLPGDTNSSFPTSLALSIPTGL